MNLIIAENRIKAAAARYKKQGYIVSNIEKKQYNLEVTISDGTDKIKYQVYFGKNGVKEVFQGNKATQLYLDLCGDNSESRTENNLNEPDEYIGSDEAGKGDFFGPLVIASVFIDRKSSSELRKIGVADSKTISDTKIKVLAEKIYNLTYPNFSVFVIEPETYNKLYLKYNNLNKLLNKAHAKTIEDVLIKTSAKNIIIDKFSSLQLTFNQNWDDVKINYFTQAEKYTAVAAASILARNALIEWFENKENEGFYLPKGASSIVDQRARELKITFGENIFEKLAKLHFKTLKKI